MPVNAYDNINYASYTPISMQEMWAPAAQLREQHDKLQEEYANAEQLAQQGFSGLNPEIDKEALTIHKQFMDQTKAAADELATKGFIDSGRRRNLLQLKSVYSNQVAPLQQQIALRANRSEELRKIQQEHPDFISTGNPMSVGITKGLKDPNAYNYTGMKGDVLAKSVADKAVELGKRIEGMPKYRHTNIPFNMFALLKSGASAEDVGAAMLHAGYKNEDANGIVGELQNMVRGTLDQYQVDDKFGHDPVALKKAYDFANAGLYKAIGDNKPMTAEDQWGLHMAEQKEKPQPIDNGYKRSSFESPTIMNSPKYKALEDLRNEAINSQTTYNKAQAHPLLAQLAGSNTVEMSKPGVKGSYGNNIQKIYDMARKYGKLPEWTKTGKVSKTDLNDFINGVVDAEQMRLKSAVQSKLFTTDDKFPEENVLNMARSLNIDLSDLKDSDKKINKASLSIHRDPIKGGITVSNGTKEKTLGYNILGNDAWVKNSNIQAFDNYNKQIFDGNVDINKLYKDKLIIPDLKNKGHYMFADPVYFDINENRYKHMLNSYSKEELQDAYSDPDLSAYLNGKNYEFNSAIESNLTTQNEGRKLTPPKK